MNIAYESLASREMTVEEEIKALNLDKVTEDRILDKYNHEKTMHAINKKDYEKAVRKQSELIDAYRKILEDTILYKWR